MRLLRRLGGWFRCRIGDHDLTSKAEQEIEPDRARMRADPVGYFFEFSQVYCARSGCDFTFPLRGGRA